MKKKIIMAMTMLITATAISVCEKEVVVASANMTNLTTILNEQSPLTETIGYDKDFAESYGYTFSKMHACIHDTNIDCQCTKSSIHRR